jgi:superfamily I DNA and RNA helicase
LKKKHTVDEDQQLKIDHAINAKLRSEALKKNTLLLPPEQKGPEDVSYAKPVQGYEDNQKLSELNGLFDAVCEEIEERQNYLEEIDQLGLTEDPQMKNNRARIKREITERVAELQKINKLIKLEREGSSKN